jgi:hypothetical protein
MVLCAYLTALRLTLPVYITNTMTITVASTKELSFFEGPLQGKVAPGVSFS